MLELALLLTGVLSIALENPIWIVWWILVAFVYVIVCVVRVSRSVRRPAVAPTPSPLVGGRAGLLFTIFASLVGVGSGLQIVLDDQAQFKLIGVPAVLLAWAILHFGYAERYASAYYSALPVKQFEFPESAQPNYADFAYFAFTVGTTFAVSDVETRTTAARARVLSHSVLSFLYNTATLGIAIGVITGGK